MSWGLPFVSSSIGGRWTPPRSRSATPTRSPRDLSASPCGGQLALIPSAPGARAPARSRGVPGAPYGNAAGGYYGGQSAEMDYNGSWRALEDQGLTAVASSGRRGGGPVGGFPVPTLPAANAGLAQTLQGMVAAEIDRARERWVLISKRLDNAEQRLGTSEERLLVAAAAALSTKERQTRAKTLAHSPQRPPDHNNRGGTVALKTSEGAVKIASRRNNKLEVALVAWRMHSAAGKQIRSLTGRLEAVARRMSTVQEVTHTKREAVLEATDTAIRLADTHPNPSAHAQLYVSAWRWACREAALQEHVEDVGKHALSVVWTARTCVQSWVKFIEANNHELKQESEEAAWREEEIKQDALLLAEKLSYFTSRLEKKRRRERAFLGWRIYKITKKSNEDGAVEFKKYVAEMMATNGVMKMMNKLLLSWALMLRCEKLERNLTAELEMQKKTSDAEIAALRRAMAEGSDARTEMLASKFAAQRKAEKLRTVMTAWSKVARDDAAQKKQEALAKKQQEEMEKEIKKATSSYSKEIEELQKREREKGDHTAELIANNYRKNLEEKLKNRCLDGWQDVVKDEIAMKKLQAEKQRREQELQEMKKLHDRQGDKTAELLEKNFREQRERNMLNELMEIWSAGIAEKLAEKKHAAVHAARQEELQKLQEAYRQREEHDEHTADLVAQQWRARVEREMVNEIYEVWSHHAAERSVAKKKEEADKAHQAQMESLKSAYADKGDKQAEMMAEKFRANQEEEVKEQIWAAWYKFLQDELHQKALNKAKLEEEKHLEEQRQKAAAEKQAELDELKNAYRQAGDETAQKMADKFREDLEEKLMIRVLTTLRDYVEDELHKRKLQEERERSRRQQEEAERTRAAELAEARKEYEKQKEEAENLRRTELEEMKKMEREKGDHHAELMAKKFREAKLREIQARSYNAWFNVAHEGTRKKMIEEERAAAQRDKENELEKLRSQEREKGDATAERMAKKFHQQRQDTFKIKILDEWQELAELSTMERRFAEERAAAKNAQAKELEELKQKHQKEKEDMSEQDHKTAERMAEQFRHQRLVDLQEQILAAWSKRAKIEAVQKGADAELEKLKAQARKKGDETAEMMANQFRRAREVEWAQKVASAWGRFAHEEAFESRRRAERALAAEKFAEQKLLEWMSRCMRGWSAEAHTEALQRRTEEQEQAYNERMQKLQDEYQSKQEETGEQLAQHFRRAADEKHKQRVLVAWAQEFRAQGLERQHAAELSRLRQAVDSGSAVMTDATMEKMAAKYRQVLEAKLIKECWEQWQVVSHDRVVEKRLEKEREELQRQHDEKLADELDELRKKERVKGDETAEKIADKAVEARNAMLANACFEGWSHETEVNTKRRLEEHFNKDMDDMKRLYSGRDDKTAERMAEQFRKMRLIELMQQCMIAWVKDALSTAKVAQEREKAAKDAMSKIQKKAEKELKELKQDYVGKNEKTAEKLAERFRKQRDMEFLRFIIDMMAQDVHEKVRKQANSKKAEELEALLKKDREKGDETAERIAEHYRKELETKLLDTLMDEWSRSAQKFAAQQKLDKELANLKAKDRKAGDRQAELMAKQYRKSKDARLLSQVLYEWSDEASQGAKGAATEFGVQADVLMMPSEEDRSAVQNAYMKTKVDVALKEIARLESEKAILRLELVAQRRRGDGALRRSDIVVSRAARILFVRALRVTRERTFLSWMRESVLSAASRREERAEAAAQKYVQTQHSQQKSRDAWSSAGGAQSALRVAVDGGPFRLVDVNWQYNSYEDPNSL